MKRKLFLTMAVGAMMLTACNKDDLGGTFLSNQTISATLVDENPQTRTTLNGLQVVWSTDDKISVFAENGESVSNNEGKIKTGVGTTSATFEVVLEGTTKIAAAYPYMQGTKYADGKISMTLPDAYSYSENGIGGAPMAAQINNNTTVIAFKNAGALMGLTVNNIPAGYKQAILTSKGSEAITGTCEITFDSEGKPTIKTTTAATGKTITINFDAAQTVTNKTFYFPIPVDEYESLELSISNGTETKVLKTKGLNAARSMRYKTTLTLDVVSGETPVDVSGAAAATQKLAEGSNSVNVTIQDNETEPTISLPNNQSNNPTSLSFESIPTGKTVTIQASTEATQVSDNVNISASSDANSNNSFVINLPNSTVSLSANGETATYSSVTATTAANTLIIGNGVTVTDLKVKGGNVRVQGNVSAISREENSDEVTYIIKEDGATIPSTLGDGFSVVSAAEWDLRKAIEAGTDFTLSDNIDVVGNRMTLPTGKTMTLDLNGKTITWNTSDSYGIQNEGTLTIKNGTINFTGGHQAGAAVRNKNVITMNNVSITANAKCFFNNGEWTEGNTSLTQHGTNPTLTAIINGGTFKSNPGHFTQGYHIYAIHNQFYSNLVMTGATVEGDGGVSVDASYATLTNVKATHTCTTGAHDFYVACGNATVSGCTFANAAAYSDTKYGNAVVNNTVYELAEGQTSTTKTIVFDEDNANVGAGSNTGGVASGE